MNNKFIIVLLFLFVTAGSVVGANPFEISGVDVYNLTAPDSEKTLVAAGPVILWRTDEWALVLPDSISGADSLIRVKSDTAFFLLFSFNAKQDASLAEIPEIVALGQRIWLVPGNETQMENIAAAGIEVVRLGSAFSWSPATTSAIPISVNWMEEVQQVVDAVSENQFIQDLTTLADFQTRHSRTQGCLDAGVWISGVFSDLGYNVSEQHHTTNMAPNIIAELPGTVSADDIIIICGHYDSISAQYQTLAPGADDNGTGTSATLQAARVLEGRSFEKTIRFIAFSGEEQGLYGSKAYAAEAAAANENIIAVFNFDMIGWVNPAPEDLDCIGNQNSSELVDYFIDCANTYTTLPTRRLINGSITYSDHSPFWNRGYPAILGIEDNPISYPYYHTIHDTVDKVNAGFATEVTRAAVAAVAFMAYPAHSPPTPTPGPETNMELILNQTQFTPGDFFRLDVAYWNQSVEAVDAVMAVILEIDGRFWFYPSWSGSVDYQPMYFPADLDRSEETIVEFVWPESTLHNDNARFWGFLMTPDLSAVIGEVDQIMWRF